MDELNKILEAHIFYNEFTNVWFVEYETLKEDLKSLIYEKMAEAKQEVK